MLTSFLATLNYWPVVVAAAAYWILGAIWFSVLFGKTWGEELEKHGVKIKEPTKQELMMKLIQTFIWNLVVALGVAFLVFMTNSQSVLSGINIGLFAGVCFSAATFGIAYAWESRSVALFLVDCGYPVVGIIVCSVILSVWR